MAIQPNFAKLKTQLQLSNIQNTNPSLFQVINQLIDSLTQEQKAITTIINNNTGGISDIKNSDFLTHSDESVDLPNSRELLAGARINFNDSVANERTVRADAIDQLTGDVTAGPGSGSQVATIPNDTVTYAKIQNVSAASRLLGRGSAGGAGDVEEITLGANIIMTGTSLSAESSDWDVLTDGDIDETELIFAGGEVIMLETP